LLRLSTRTRAYEIFSNSADGDRDYFAGVVFSRSLEIVIKSRTNTADLIQNVGVPVRPWILTKFTNSSAAYRATAEFFDHRLAASDEQQ
jgi:hypothetical protein